MKKKSGFAKWIILFCIIGALLLLSYQVYNYFFVSVQTEFAVRASMEDTFTVSGIFCRNEIPLSKSGNGYYDIIRADGEKVSSGGTIACIYKNESDVKVQELIRQIQLKIDEYNAAMTAKSSFSGDSSAYDQSIEEYTFSLSDGVLKNDASVANDAIENLKNSIFIKEIVSGDIDNFKEKINELIAEKNKLSATALGTVSYLTAERAGYYSKYTDNYENKLTLDSLKDYDITSFKNLYLKLSENTNSNTECFGKLISDYKWQYYFVTTQQNASRYNVGYKMNLRFSSVSNQIITTTVISKITESDNVLIGLECSSIQPELLSSRILDADVIAKTYSGIRIDKNSLRIVNKQNGVYLKVGSIVKFKKVNVLYIGNTYALIEANTANGISNFDEIIVGGKNLYDGKVLT